ncbi:MAG: hypothetical protein LBM04_09695, partial [Opitutaceae bacterium]|nr:hypothetical protein [Opitutaceae bacterium]
TNTASGTLNVNVNASTLTSDIANTGGGVTALALDADSHGRGRFNGGSLSLLDTLSTWNFTAPSTLDHVSNAGTLDLGDHETRFGALHHTGTLNLTVDTDTGAGGRTCSGRSAGILPAFRA